jgi:hypothetical protein
MNEEALAQWGLWREKKKCFRFSIANGEVADSELVINKYGPLNRMMDW